MVEQLRISAPVIRFSISSSIMEITDSAVNELHSSRFLNSVSGAHRSAGVSSNSAAKCATNTIISAKAVRKTDGCGFCYHLFLVGRISMGNRK